MLMMAASFSPNPLSVESAFGVELFPVPVPEAWGNELGVAS